MTGRHLPYSLKPEFVRGCTMRCVFCGLKHQTWAEAPYEYISMDLWQKYIAAAQEWRPKVRIEIANRGEPTIHPQFIDLIKEARRAMPKAQLLVSTNGDLSGMIGLPEFRNFVIEAQQAGVNAFLLDCYTPKRLREFRELFEGMAGAFFSEESATKAGLNPYPYRGPDWKAVIIKDAVPHKLEDGSKAPKQDVLLKYHNQGGNARVDGPAAAIYPNVQPPKEPLERMCVRPFREFPMWYDGTVPLCCDDWAEKHVVGKFPDMSLQELWDAYDPARRELIKRNRAGIPELCAGCTEGHGKRFGLELKWFENDGA